MIRCSFCMVHDETSDKEGVCKDCLPLTIKDPDTGQRTMSMDNYQLNQEKFLERSAPVLKGLEDDMSVSEMFEQLEEDEDD